MNGMTDDAERRYDGAVGVLDDPDGPEDVQMITDDTIDLLWVCLESPVSESAISGFRDDIESVADVLDCQIVVTDDRAQPVDVPDDTLDRLADRVAEKL